MQPLRVDRSLLPAAQMSRERLIRDLMSKFHASTEAKLMDALQDLGLVSDEAVMIYDCSDRDLMAALNPFFSSFPLHFSPER